MEALQIKKLADLDDTYQEKVAEVFVDGFYDAFLYTFSKEKQALVNALKHCFKKEFYYTGLLNDQVVGIIAYSTNKERAQQLDKKILQKELGTLKGSLCHFLLSRELENPLDMPDNQIYIESIATRKEARGKGVATKLIHHVMDELEYDEVTLEVVDTNTNAVRLYEKLGFSIFKRKKKRFFREQAGFNERLYMIKHIKKQAHQ